MDFFAAGLQGDALSATLALGLLAMSVASWAVIFYKTWLLHRVSADVAHGKGAFWQARDVQQGIQALVAPWHWSIICTVIWLKIENGFQSQSLKC